MLFYIGYYKDRSKTPKKEHEFLISAIMLRIETK